MVRCLSMTDNPFNAANPHYLRIESEGNAPLGVANEGFRGMGVKQGRNLRFLRASRGMSPARRPCGLNFIPATAKFSTRCGSQEFFLRLEKIHRRLASESHRRQGEVVCADRGQGRRGSRLHFALSGAHLEKSPRRFARGHGAGAGRFASRLSAFPRRLHRGRSDA